MNTKLKIGLLLLSVMVLLMPQTLAYPSLGNIASCTTCHVNSNGGKELTPAGEYYKQNGQLPTPDPTEPVTTPTPTEPVTTPTPTEPVTTPTPTEPVTTPTPTEPVTTPTPTITTPIPEFPGSPMVVVVAGVLLVVLMFLIRKGK
ncbi:MAG TPA: hypothetical protein VIO11_04225 [Candidatus Methanoperedens sp.]